MALGDTTTWLRRIWSATALLLALWLVLPLAGCLRMDELDPIAYVIGVSQADMREPWRLVLAEELREEAAKYPQVRLIFTDATRDSAQQIRDIERLREYGIDLLIVSPCDAEELTPVISGIYQDIPVIVLDRMVEGYDYTLFVGPDNELIGRQAGAEVIGLLDTDQRCTVLELRGAEDSKTTADRTSGFRRVINSYDNIRREALSIPAESRDAAEDAVLLMNGELDGVDVIFAHNDYMAMGAHKALKQLNLEDIPIVGIDGFSGENGGLAMIREGIIERTITCPTGGREAIRYAMDILGHEKGVPKQVILRSHAISRENCQAYERMLEREPVAPEEPIRVGYAMIGEESGWRLANNNSIVTAAKDFGIDLTVLDANQSQTRQIEAIRTFIADGMDVIVLSPVNESGWKEILEEAKAAGIPVLLSDRKAAVGQEDLYTTFIGADFIEEGRRAMRWVLDNLPADPYPVRIMEIQGSLDASPTIERKQGFEMRMEGNPGYRIVHSRSGNFTLEGGRAVVQDYLQNHSWDIDVIYAHNDDMALGAVQALEAAGLSPGRDVKILSVDGTKNAVQAIIDGKINCVVECSPLLGPQLMKAITDLMQGKELPLRIITDEIVFTEENAKAEIGSREY